MCNQQNAENRNSWPGNGQGQNICCCWLVTRSYCIFFFKSKLYNASFHSFWPLFIHYLTLQGTFIQLSAPGCPRVPFGLQGSNSLLSRWVFCGYFSSSSALPQCARVLCLTKQLLHRHYATIKRRPCLHFFFFALDRLNRAR